MSVHADVLVVGAGVTGLSTAYSLCKRGKKVILAEKTAMGAGASGACDDMILLQSKKPGILLEMAFKSLELFRNLEKDLPNNIELENRGGMILIENEFQLKAMEEFAASQNKYGLGVEIVDKKQVKKLQPNVSDHIIASTYCSQDSQVNPMELMKAFMLASRSMGMNMVTRVHPVELKQNASKWTARLSDGTVVESEAVVNATGVHANEVCGLVGIEVPITPLKGQVLVTEQLPRIGETNVWSALYIASKLKKNELVGTSNPMAEKYGLGFAFSGTLSGTYLIGSTREKAGFDRTTIPEAIALLGNQARHFFPVLANAHIIRTFAGLRPSTPDGMPFVGEFSALPGFYIAAGHEGDGIALSAITGKVVADMICGVTPEFDLSELTADRFMGKQEKIHGAG